VASEVRAAGDGDGEDRMVMVRQVAGEVKVGAVRKVSSGCGQILARSP